MDATLGRLVDFATGVRLSDVPQPVLDAAVDSIVDGVGCGIAGRSSPAAIVAQDMVADCAAGPTSGRMINIPAFKSADAAAFVNTASIRDLDLNDTFGLGHPSDMLGPLLAVGGARGSSGPELVLATVICYEVWMRFGITIHRPNHHVDQGLGMGIATAAGLSSLLGLPRAQAANALAITAAGGVPLRASRAGQLSNWKGAATAQAGRNATFATLLAGRGITGPDRPFEGRHGLWDVLGGERRELRPPLPTDGGFLLPQRRLKAWPVAYNMQPAIWAARDLHGQLGADEIQAIDIAVDSTAIDISGSDPEKWAPETRETADHSLPYAVVWTLMHGDFGFDALQPQSYRNPAVRSLMKLVTVSCDPALDAGWPDHVGARVTVRDRHDGVREAEVVDPPGHPDRPFSAEQLREKFQRLTVPIVGEDRAARLFDAWRHILGEANVARLLDLLAQPG